MPLLNADIAGALEEIADLLEVQGANAFRVRAYRRAARTLGELGRSVRAMLAEGADLDDLPGIGADLAGKIGQIARTGTCELLEQLRRDVPRAVPLLLRLPRMGPNRVRALRAALGVESLEQLRDAAAAHRIREVRGFGPKTEQQVADALARQLDAGRRFPLQEADEVARRLLIVLRAIPGVARAEAAGSLRRRRETVGDVDLLVACSRSAEVMRWFTTGSGVSSVIAKGPTRASVVLRGGMQVDLRVVPASSFGAAWLYFTGSKAHNIALRRMAQSRGLKLNEYGLFRQRGRIAGASEEEVYAALGLHWIPPEMREDRGEIEAARVAVDGGPAARVHDAVELPA